MAEYVGECDVDHHPHKDTPGIATHIHKKQLEDARTDARQLRAENAALKAQLGEQAWRRNTPEGDLLIALAEAFDIAHAFADAAPSGPLLKPLDSWCFRRTPLGETRLLRMGKRRGSNLLTQETYR